MREGGRGKEEGELWSRKMEYTRSCSVTYIYNHCGCEPF